jgi:hypothetical protein
MYLPQAIIQRAMDVLANQIPACSSLNNAVIGQSIGDLGEQLTFVYTC